MLRSPWYRWTSKVLLTWFMIWGVAAQTLAEEPDKALRIRVLSYNIHHAEGIDGKLNLERIARVIAAAKPDIVALQEVDQKTERTHQVDQPTELARLTGMAVAFGGNIRLQGGAYGNAVLSKYPLKRHENHALPCFQKGEQRGVLEVEMEVPGLAEPLLLLATHLDHRADDRERVASATQINERATKAGQRPMLLAGDLNDVLESQTLKALQTVWTCANREPKPTIPVDKPTRQIDFILVRPIERWQVLEVSVLEEAIASDHRAVLAVLELQRETAKDRDAANAPPRPSRQRHRR